MSLFRRTALALAPLSLIAASTAQAAPGACLTTPEAEAVTTVALPAIIRSAGVACAASVPPGAVIRQDQGPFIDRYTIAADQAWPAAKSALMKLGSSAIAPLLDSEMARPMLAGLLAPAIVGKIDPRDCPMIDHMATLLAPLPPRNVAGLVVSGVMLAREQSAKHGQPAKGLLDLPLCTEDRY